VKPTEYVLTSGGEIRLSKAIADSLQLRAANEPTAEIVFDIWVDSRAVSPATIERARDQALEKGDFDPRDDKDARDRMAALIVRRQGKPEFRKKLLRAYENRCAISRCDSPHALEAAHIRPYMGRHTNHIKNGIVLRCDLHTLFDLGKISITPDFKVNISDEMLSTVYKEFHNKALYLPKEQKHWPDCSGST
jgi:putative restriction endonuclease